MKTVAFTKMQGLGNDFIMINKLDYDKDTAYFAHRASRLCDRHFGIGADGLVIIDRGREAPFRMRIFNPDGSEAEMCGNALRCLARYLWERGFCKEPDFSLETGAGLKKISLRLQGRAVQAVRVDMGPPILNSTDIPVGGPARRVINEPLKVEGQGLTFTAVSMGNPHCVIFLPDLADIPWLHWGRKLENDPLFPRRVNVEFTRILNPTEAEVKVWERGAGPTLACGTGACAVAVAGILTGRLRSPVSVHLPGGTLRISWEEGAAVTMEGPAREVFNGVFSTES